MVFIVIVVDLPLAVLSVPEHPLPAERLRLADEDGKPLGSQRMPVN
jgi:hypothetical protein